MTAEKIAVETIVAAPIKDVWRAYTNPADIKQWNAASDDWHTAAASVDLRVGGVFSSRMEAKDGSMGFDFAGTYTEIIEHQRIGYSFGGLTAQVEFSVGKMDVNLRVTFDAEDTHPIEMQRGGWQAILNNFARHVERKAKKNTVCVWFNDDAEAAANFYATTFPNSSVDAVHLAPSDYPGGKAGQVLTVAFTVCGVPCIGLNGGDVFKHCAAFSFQIATDDQAETDLYWNAIVGNGGQESACGWCKDKWGLSWQITPRVLTNAMATGGDVAKRAFAVMMEMRKIDVAKIESAIAATS